MGRGAIALWIALISAQRFGPDSRAASIWFRTIVIAACHSLTAIRPRRLRVAYDDAQGGYAGAFASTVRLAAPYHRGRTGYCLHPGMPSNGLPG